MLGRLFRIAIICILTISLLAAATVWSMAKITELRHLKLVAESIVEADDELKVLLNKAYDSALEMRSKGVKKYETQVGQLIVSIDYAELAKMKPKDFREYVIDQLVEQIYHSRANSTFGDLRSLKKKNPLNTASTIFSFSLHQQLLFYRSVAVVASITLAFMLLMAYEGSSMGITYLGVSAFIAGLLGWFTRLAIYSKIIKVGSEVGLPEAAKEIINSEMAIFFMPINGFVIIGLLLIFGAAIYRMKGSNNS